MTTVEKLGNKCTNTTCHKECPIWWFNHKGAGVGTGNNCMESMRFPAVAKAVNQWLRGKEWNKSSLGFFGNEGSEK